MYMYVQYITIKQHVYMQQSSWDVQQYKFRLVYNSAWEVNSSTN